MPFIKPYSKEQTSGSHYGHASTIRLSTAQMGLFHIHSDYALTYHNAFFSISFGL